MPRDPEDRRAALSRSLEEVRARIDAAARAAGRDPAEVSLLAVTKTWPASDVAHLVDLGLAEFGENKEQEGAAKADELARLRPGAAVRWRIVGRLQRNKARHLARWAHAVDSVDSERLVDALDRAAGNARDAGERSGPLAVLVQVSLDDAPGRGGASIADVPALADRVAQSEHLSLDGVMTVAPQHADPAEAFATFAELAGRVVAAHPGATTLSAGMSGDLEAAIEHGSTCVRVGTALLGAR
ncbi:YggS family pyridoxal phosphate-dependent enzyme [Actinomycetospora sp. TBRC 11914]|uniref:YggS family pyridoxal phosphate-dependent enzyme n=1 Tax=Actinomycetospora sp. TBRC 11914 TaxID=2729387 RepID=UPI00145DF72C|nr:YggS family pyridoxal phosphate-dependent enzyme [Actinomycetospora sp. TBRC 11914]NMO93306.1 YggS family pyridoxal phosphate-dependent enzyme [Actinomycetospora sp. TBRC 11914]